MDVRFRLTIAAVAAACAALVTTGCSKGSAGLGVAQLKTSAASAAASSGAAPAASSSSPPKGEAGLLAYSQCMRAHGVPDFPDPVGNGLQIKAGPGSDLDANSPQMVAAQKACKSLQPGGEGGGKASAAQEAEALKYSACMRSHGVPNFPDPIFSNGDIQLKVTNVDPNSPQFVAAQKACQSLQPGRGDDTVTQGQADQGAAGGGSQTNTGP